MSLNKILLVDDDEDDRLFFTDAVKEINQALICEEANNGLEAILHLVTKPPIPDIIFLDLNMPKMNGHEFLIYIKKENKYKHIPIVIYTTSKIQEEIDRTLKMGATYFFSKPTDYLKLKTELQKILTQNNL